VEAADLKRIEHLPFLTVADPAALYSGGLASFTAKAREGERDYDSYQT
jgi:hypothetical protein